ncbi:30S ribosomal protein S15 [Gammaproteobacteria bacterium SCGC AG-212-F23]|nr:30S ribosomal protein S15 [Gammaproteobacteria bacterium SCGC AG-212-F23]
MAFTAATKAEIIKKYSKAKNDTGSTEVQIALLSARIDYLTNHLSKHQHDVHTRYGLTNLVSKRRRLLNYLKRTDIEAYRKLIEKLDVRG